METLYRYGDEFYTIKELEEMLSSKSSEDRKFSEDIIAHGILAEIMKQGKKPIVGRKLKKLAETEYVQHEYDLYGLKEHLINRKRVRRLNSAAGLFANSFSRTDLHNGESFLDQLLHDTLGYSYPVSESDDMKLVDFERLTEEQCIALAKNFKRIMRKKEAIPMDEGRAR